MPHASTQRCQPNRSKAKSPCFFKSSLGWLAIVVATLRLSLPAWADDYESKPSDSYFAIFNPRKAPDTGLLLLHPGDRLAIIGDSITEQKMYSRIVETYLTVCVPELKITARQFGWSGETAEGFRKRMSQDCLRFQPTVATLCYGMNDSRYRPFDCLNGEWYQSNYTAVVHGLKNAGARVVLGSPGCTGKVPHWVKGKEGTLDELNLNLCTLRDLDIGIARQEDTRFADVFWTMFKAGFEGQKKYTKPEQSYEISGKDGVHPDWAGHLVMAYTFLRSMGLDGNIGTLTIDMGKQTATASSGHIVESFTNSELTVVSTKYPFCVTGESNRDNSIRSGTTLVPFFQDLDRFLLVVTNAMAVQYQVTWGTETNIYSAAQLAAGVNLAEDFKVNPFLEAFQRVDEAVAAKQAYETVQIKKIFHGPEGAADLEKAVGRTESERTLIASAIADAMRSVRHTIRIQAIQ